MQVIGVKARTGERERAQQFYLFFLAYSVLVACQLFTIMSLIVALHYSAPRRVRLPVPLSFSTSLVLRSIVLCER